MRRIRFQDLMCRRVHHILLVSSLYDSFILAEDGQLSALLVNQFEALNMGSNPDITRVSTGEEALSRIRQANRVDLIITSAQVGDMDAAEQAYFKRRALFDKHITELPIELLLFAAGTHVDLGGEADHQRAEELLRGWLIKNGESDQVAARDKARVQLLLARNYLGSQRYDVARSEFTTLLNLYPKEAEAVDAKFGIGETYMAQGIEDLAGEIFADLTTSSEPRVAIRADLF